MLLFNAVVLSVLVMLILSVARVHVVISLFVASLVGGLVAGMGMSGTMVAFQDGLAGGAKIALSYALLGAFAMSVAHSGLPRLLANWIIKKLRNADESNSARVARSAKWGIIGGVLVMGVMSQNLIPIHIAFIPLLVPPLIGVMNELKMDRRLIACAITFGIVTTYMFVPIGFGRIFLHDILYKNIEDAGLPVEGIVNPMAAMVIPAASMAVGCAIALLVSYRKPREYEQRETSFSSNSDKPIDMKKVWAAVAALVACFGRHDQDGFRGRPAARGFPGGPVHDACDARRSVAAGRRRVQRRHEDDEPHRPHHDHRTGLRVRPEGVRPD